MTTLEGSRTTRGDSDNGRTTDVFLSYNRLDATIVRAVAGTMRQQGLRIWLDEWCLVKGFRIIDQVDAALRHTRCCAVFIGEADLGSFEREEAHLAFERLRQDPEFRVFLVLLPGLRDPVELRGVAAVLGNRLWVDLRRALDLMEATRLLIAAVRGESDGPASPETHCPYRGLLSFGEANAADFFGRQADVQRIVERLKSARLLALIGPSGSGKSSVVHAGLLPSLRRGALGRYRLATRTILPGNQPLAVLATALATHGPENDKVRLEHELRQRGTTMVDHLRDHVPRDGIFVLIVDQFEQLFTLGTPEHERTQFVTNLIEATSRNRQILVILSMRSDDYGRALAEPALAQRLASNHYLLGAMTPNDVRDAVVLPAERARVTFEDGLVSEILSDLGPRPSLPLLQHALVQMWEQRTDSRLTLSAYRQIGGVRGALMQRAEEIWQSFAPAAQERGRQLLVRLVAVGEGKSDHARPSYTGVLSRVRHPTN